MRLRTTLFGRSLPATASFRDVALRVIWQHGRWIEATPSTHSSANNHRLGELSALVVISLLAPELADAARWLPGSLRALEREASRQILADGTGAERAFAYHLIVIDLLLVVVSLMRAQGLDDSAPLMSALGRAADGLAMETDVGEPDPRYGDSDGSTVLGPRLRCRSWSARGCGLACGVARTRRRPSACR